MRWPIARLKAEILSLFFPAVRCVCCKSEEALDARSLCASCARAIAEAAVLSRRVEDALCLAAYDYEKSPAGKLVARLKFEGIFACGRILGEGMAPAVARSGAAFDVIVPVPISKRRLRERGFNQSLIICRALAHELDKPCAELLSKTRHTREQRLLSKEERRMNVRGAYAALGVRDKRILLVDDVLTTGATALACRRTLLEAGAAQVTVFCATIVRESDALPL